MPSCYPRSKPTDSGRVVLTRCSERTPTTRQHFVEYHGAASAAAIAAPKSPPPGMRCPYNVVPPCPEYVATIYNARYPPLYYSIVGLPSLLADSNWAVYLMRLFSAALSSLFIALAVTSAYVWSKNRLLIAGIVIAATPMVMYLAGIINPKWAGRCFGTSPCSHRDDSCARAP